MELGHMLREVSLWARMMLSICMRWRMGDVKIWSDK